MHRWGKVVEGLTGRIMYTPCNYIQEGILGQFFQTQCGVPIPQPYQLLVEEVDLVMCVHEGQR